MRKLTVFNNVTVDGYFTDKKSDMSWAHAGSDDPEFREFTANNARGGGPLLLGRVTYDLLASYWPSPEALKNNREVADGINKAPKFVFSRTLKNPSWNNTMVISGDPVSEV